MKEGHAFLIWLELFFYFLVKDVEITERDLHTRADFLEDDICACKLFIWKNVHRKEIKS